MNLWQLLPSLLVWLPLGAGLALVIARHPSASRPLALAVSSLVFALALGAQAAGHRLSHPALPWAAGLSLAVLLFFPKYSPRPQSFGQLLLCEAGFMGAANAQELWQVAAFLLLAKLSTFSLRAEAERRAETLYLMAQLVPLSIGLALLLCVEPLRHATFVSRGLPWPVCAAFAMCAVFMLPLAPFHGWLQWGYAGKDRGAELLLSALPFGTLLLSKIRVPLQDVAPRGLKALAVAGAATAVYGAMVALSQRSPQRTVGSVAVSAAGVAAFGMGAAHHPMAMEASWLFAISVSTCLVGLCVLLWALEERIGRERLLSANGLGLVTQTPSLAGCFALLSLGFLGFPGSLGFVAEELLVGSSFADHPWATGALLFSVALNGFTIYRLFTRLFFGPVQFDIPDLRRLERGVALAILAAVIAAGLFPHFVVPPQAH